MEDDVFFCLSRLVVCLSQEPGVSNIFLNNKTWSAVFCLFLGVGSKCYSLEFGWIAQCGSV